MIGHDVVVHLPAHGPDGERIPHGLQLAFPGPCAIRPAAHQPAVLLAPGEGGFSGQTTPVVFDYLLGYPLWVNNDIAAPVASGISLLFGDYSYYKIRDALDIVMFRVTDSAYAKLGQVGFLAWMRTGGNLVDLNAVKSYQHSAT